MPAAHLSTYTFYWTFYCISFLIVITFFIHDLFCIILPVFTSSFSLKHTFYHFHASSLLLALDPFTGINIPLWQFFIQYAPLEPSLSLLLKLLSMHNFHAFMPSLILLSTILTLCLVCIFLVLPYSALHFKDLGLAFCNGTMFLKLRV